jgi:putative ABC transport system ATP-binding protein
MNEAQQTTALDSSRSPTANRQSGTPIICLRNVTKVYPGAVADFPALDRVTLSVYPGEFLGIVGKSGAGKTTLLNMIAGVSEITSGEVIFQTSSHGLDQNGRGRYAVHAMNENETAVWRGQNVGIVYQSFELLPMLDLIDNVLLPQDFTGLYNPDRSRQRALEVLQMVELEEHAHKLPTQISGGQKQRIAIARALINDPPLILADEPTGNLDSVTAETIFQIFERLVARQKTVIMVTHDLDLARRFSRRLQIVDGKIVNDTATSQNPPGTAQQPLLAAQPSFTPVTAVKGDGQTPSRPAAAKLPPNVPDNSSLYAGLSKVESDRSRPAILLKNVVKTYVSEAGAFTALRGIDLRLNYGQFVSIVGKSGSGKSTLLNMITGIDHPTSGDVIVDEKRIYDMSESQRALWRGQEIGIVFQFFQLLPMLTLLENTMLPMDYTNTFPGLEREARARQLLAMVGLQDHVHKLPAAVSSGQQQSAAIARALATDPPIIVADEPTGNLDSHAAEAIIRLFEELAAKGKTILIVTHDPSLTSRTDQNILIADGLILPRKEAAHV